MNIGTAHPVFGLTPEDPNDRVHVLRIPDREGGDVRRLPAGAGGDDRTLWAS